MDSLNGTHIIKYNLKLEKERSMRLIQTHLKKLALIAAALIGIVSVITYAEIFRNRAPVDLDLQSYERGDGFGELTFSFSDDVFELSDLDTMTQKIQRVMDIRVEPALKGRFKPVGTRQVVFEFTEKLLPATRYQVTMNNKNIRSLKNEPVEIRVNYQELKSDTFFFQTTRPTVYFSAGSEKPGDPRMLRFNLQMKLDSIYSNMRISGEGVSRHSYRLEYQVYTNTRKVNQKKITEIKTNFNTVLVRVPDEVKAGDYQIFIDKDVRAIVGNVGLREDFRARYETYRPFVISEKSSSYVEGNGPRYFPDVTVIFRANNAIQTARHISNYVKVTPRVEKLSVGFNGSDLQITGNFKGGETYHFEIGTNLTDIYGQTLEKGYSADIEFEHFFSYLAVPRGYLVMESYLPAILPFKVRNVEAISFQYAVAQTENEMIDFLKNNVEYLNDGRHRREKEIRIKWRWDRFYNYRLDLLPYIQEKKGFLIYKINPEMLVSPYSGDCANAYSFYGVVLFSDMGITVKSGPYDTLILVRTLKDNQPVAGARVVSIEDGKKTELGKTDPSGILRLGTGYNANRLGIVMAEKNGQYTFNVQSSVNAWCDETRPNTSPNILSWGNEYAYQQTRAILFSDRKLYRPGEIIDLKGVIRFREKDDWRPANSRKYSVRIDIYNPKNEKITNAEMKPDENGGFHFRFSLDKEAPTGYYRTSVSGGNDPDHISELYDDYIRVEDFKPARAEMKIIPNKNLYQWGETLEADLIGWYLFGAPVGKPIDYSVSVRPVTFRSKRYPEFRFGNNIYSYYYDEEGGYYDGEYRETSLPQNLASGRLVPDAEGRAQLKLPLRSDRLKGDAELILSAKTLLDDQSTVYGVKAGMDLFQSVHVGIRKSGYFFTENGEKNIQLIAIDGREMIVSNTKVVAVLERVEWNSIQRAGVNGRLNWEWKEERQLVMSNLMQIGMTNLTLNNLKPGYYEFKTVYIADKRRNTSSDSFYVLGNASIGWRMNPGSGLTIQSDKENYQVGDTAQVLVQNPFKQATAWVTLEREKIHETFQLASTNSMLIIPVKITAGMIPNIYVSVSLVSGRSGNNQVRNDEDLARPKQLSGQINLKVVPDQKKLRIRLIPEKTAYEPRDTVNAEIEVLDYAGNPVNADLTLSVADRGVLNLVGYQLPNLLNYFYGPRPNAVYTYEMRDFIFGERYLSEKGEVIGGDGGLGSGMIVPRGDFRYTAFYRAKISVTNGRAKIQFTLPDNLTSFKMMASAYTPDSRFGYGEESISVKKNLMILPTMPRFVRNFDRFSGGAMFFNYTGKTQNLKITATASRQLTIAGAASNNTIVTNVRIPDNGSKEVLFNFSSDRFEVSQATYTFTASAGADSDGVKETIPVLNPQIPEVTALSEKTTGKAEHTLAISEHVKREQSSLDFTLSQSAFSDLEGSVDYLIDYPYGCLEQKLSKILPLILGEDVIVNYRLLKKYNRNDLKKIVQKVLNEIPQFKGGSSFRYWNNDWEPNAYLTVYTAFVLTMAKKAGYNIDGSTFDQALRWTVDYSAGRGNFHVFESAYYRELVRSYALYVAALNGSFNEGSLRAGYENLKTRFKDLVPAQSYILKAASYYPDFSGKADMIQSIAATLFSRTRTEANKLYFTSYNDWGWFYFDNEITTAVALQSLLEAKVNFPESFKAVYYLLKARKAGVWSTTHANAMVFWALNTYLNLYEKEEPDMKARVSVNQQEIISAMFASREEKPTNARYPLANIPGTSARVTFEREGKGTLYYTMRFRYILDNPPLERDAGFSVSKAYFDYDSGEPVSNNQFIRGNRYIVKLRIYTPKERFFVVTDDPLPAGFEPVITDFATESDEKRADQSDDGYYGFNYRENYRDRVVFMAKVLRAGEHKLQYVVRATTVGTFHYPMLKTEEMYDPEVFGTRYQPDILVVPPSK